MPTYILALESSCDETAAALFRDHELLSEHVANQAIHAAYGGVVPELASRAHQQHIVPVVDRVYQDAGIPIDHTTHIAFTQGPGLIGALLVGTSFAQGLALALDIPTVPVHHIKAHLFANWITPPYPSFPFLGLIVSGGHTQLLWVERHDKITLLGQTLDDAAGEAFDKIAKLLGFPYPGGPHIDKHAQAGNPQAFSFPITCMPNLDFSFSGIKTSVRYFLRDKTSTHPTFVADHLSDLCASVQHALVTMIAEKVTDAIAHTGTSQIVIGGGVAANSALQQRLHHIAHQTHCQLFCPPLHHCQDNAAMIGITAHHQLQHGYIPDTTLQVQPHARMPF